MKKTMINLADAHPVEVRMARQIKNLLRTSLAAMCMAACTVQVPSDIIQQEEMELLLYDYHLMQAMAGELPSTERYKRPLYEQYVFDKHGVTEAEFDSSLVWYMRHTRELEEVYTKLNKRFKARQAVLEAYVRPEERSNRITPAGDSVNVWDDFRMFRLTASPSSNRMTFSIPADSNFHKNDAFEWKINAHFLKDTSGVGAVMALTLFYDNDTVGCTIPLNGSGEQVLTLKGDSAATFKEMTGFIHYFALHDTLRLSKKAEESLAEKEMTGDSIRPAAPRGILPTALRYGDLLITDITLMRYHCPDTVKPVETDTLVVADAAMEEKKDTADGEKTKVVPAKKVTQPEAVKTERIETDMRRLEKRRSLQKR